MSLIQKQVKLRQQLQRVKELAREGEFKEAKVILDTLPDNPDVEKLRLRVNKRLYVATGAMPALDEDKPVVDSHTVAEQAQEAIAQGQPPKRDKAPSVGFINTVLHIISAMLLLWGIMLLFFAFQVPGKYLLYDASAMQMTQVYSEGIFVAVKAIAIFILVMVLQIMVFTRGQVRVA